MTTRIVTAPVDMAEERQRETLAALEEVDSRRVVEDAEVEAWAARLCLTGAKEGPEFGEKVHGSDSESELLRTARTGRISLDPVAVELGVESPVQSVTVAQVNPDSYLFSLPAGVFGGSWSITTADASKLGSLSRAYIYGMPAPVPLPAAAWLLLSGLAGFGVIARRRKPLTG